MTTNNKPEKQADSSNGHDCYGLEAKVQSIVDRMATTEYVQKEHKETTRLIVGVSLIMFAMVALTVGAVSMIYDKTTGAQVKSVQEELILVRSDIKKIAESNARIEGILLGRK